MAANPPASRRLVRLALCAIVAAPVGVGSGVALVRLGVTSSTLGLGGSSAYAVDGRALEAAERPGPGLRVLFIGNSFTFVNDMPELVRRLALTADPARPLLAVQWTPPGQLLAGDVGNASLEHVMHAVHWDAVVLQEQSQQLAQPESAWTSGTLPYASELQRESAGSGTQTVLFETWGYRDGEFAGDSFGAMQQRLDLGFRELASDLHARIAPVGPAFAQTLAEEPDAELWASDDYHPSLEGSYLAASVMLETLYGTPATASEYDGGLVPAQARVLREIAARTVAGPGAGQTDQ